jgi:MFS family permease
MSRDSSVEGADHFIPWRLVFLAIGVVVVSTQPVFLLGAAFLSVGEEFGFGTTGLGVLTAAFFLTASAASAPLGKVVQRIGWRRAMRLNAAVSGVLLVAIAVAAHRLWVLGGLVVLTGFVYGLANPAANQALADHVDPRRRALMFGMKHAGIPASTLVAGLAIPVVVVTVGWRFAYGLAAVLAVLIWVAVPSSADDEDLVSMQEDPRRYVAPLTSGLLVGLALGAALATWAAIALSTYLVAAAVDRGLTEVQAGWLLFAGSATSIAGRVVAGQVTDRIASKGFVPIAGLVAVGAGVFALLVVAEGALFAGLVLVAFATGWGWPGLMTYTVVNANAGTAAASSGITQAGIFLGAGVGPVVLGLVAEQHSFETVWLLVALALSGAALVVAGVGRAATGRNQWRPD